MRVLLVHNRYLQAGGEDSVFAAERTLLADHGHDVVEFVDSNQRVSQMSPLVLAAQTIWSRSAEQRLLRLLRDTRRGLVHVHNTFPLISPSIYYACQKASVPVAQTLHNYRLLCPVSTFNRNGRVCESCLGKTPPWPGIIHACYHGSRMHTAAVAAMLTAHRWLKTWKDQVDVYIALTKFAREKFIEGGLPGEKLFVKPNFVHPDPGARQDMGGHALFVGRLSPEKGLRTLIQAWEKLREIPLKIVGDGPLMAELQAFVHTRKLVGIEVLGWKNRTEVLALMKTARFVVFPSEWYECFPVVIAEAFACGVPVIASRLGAMMVIVQEECTGLHFLSGDPEDLAAKVEWAWTHAEETAKMGERARHDFELKYTADSNYQVLMEIYEQAIEQHRG